MMVNSKPVKLANIAILTPFSRGEMLPEMESKFVDETMSPIPKSPIIIPSMVPIKPKYKGTEMVRFISSSRLSVFLSMISLIRLKSGDENLFLKR